MFAPRILKLIPRIYIYIPGVIKGVNQADIRRYDPYNYTDMIAWLTLDSTKSLLHVDENVVFNQVLGCTRV